jgi:hypothetical protein
MFEYTSIHNTCKLHVMLDSKVIKTQLRIDWDTNINFSKKQIPDTYLIYTRFRKAILQVYTMYIPCQKFLGFPDAISGLIL